MDPYARGKVPPNVYARKCDVTGRIVAVLDAHVDDIGCRLIVQRSRCIHANDVCELIMTDEGGKKPGEVVDNVSYYAFFAADNSGVIIVGDTLRIEGKTHGTVLGFNESHAPNHINIIIHSPERTTGAEADLQLQSTVFFNQ